MKYILLSLFGIIAAQALLAQQDTIYKTDGTKIGCIIKEVGDKKIRYSRSSDSNALTFNSPKRNIEKVVLGTGEVLFTSPSLLVAAELEGQNTRAIKANLVSPALGFIELAYEQVIKPGRSAEASISYVGKSFGQHKRAEGYNFRVGLKFMKDPGYYAARNRYTHVLKGAYIRPDLLFSFLNYDQFNEDDQPIQVNSNSFGLSINLGKQIVYDNGFLVDWYFGIGYGVLENEKALRNSSLQENRFGWYQFSSDILLNINGGVKIGFLF